MLACAVCRTDLHAVDGDLPLPVLPIVPDHESIPPADSSAGMNVVHATMDPDEFVRAQPGPTAASSSALVKMNLPGARIGSVVTTIVSFAPKLPSSSSFRCGPRLRTSKGCRFSRKIDPPQ